MEKCFLNAFPGYLKFKCMYGVKVTPIMLKNIIKSVVYSCLVFDCFFNTITNTLKKYQKYTIIVTSIIKGFEMKI